MNKFLITFILAILLIGGVSALEFDNVKDYDANLREATITNAFGLGEEIARIRLVSPQDNYVLPGKDRLVAEYLFLNYKSDYTEAIKKTELYDIKNGMTEFTRGLTYKYAIDTQRVVDTSYQQCSRDAKNNSVCETIPRTNTFTDTVWVEFNDVSELPGGQVRVGLFTDVYEGDYVEQIPNFFGERITEWSTWSASFNVDLRQGYNAEQNGSNFEDVVNGIYNGTNNGMLTGIPGIVNGSWRGNADTDYILFMQNAGTFLNSNPYTISGWVNRTVACGAPDFSEIFDFRNNTFLRLQTCDDATDELEFEWEQVDSTLRRITLTSGGITTGAWYHFALVRENSTLYKGYLNGVNIANVSTDGTVKADTRDNRIGDFTTDGTQFVIDELYIWNRSLSNQEITDLFNSGNGLTYDANPANIVVDLLQPVNNSGQTTPSVFFEGALNSSGGVNLANATLYVWNSSSSVISQNFTDLSSLSTTSTQVNWTNTYADGTYHWNIFGVADDTITAWNETNFTFSIDATAPVVNITHPIGLQDYVVLPGTQELNWTITEANQDTCWVDYNNVNTTVTCGDGTTDITLSEGVYTARFYANDTSNNIGLSESNWSYKVIETNRSLNASSYETAYETYSINVTANSSLSAVTLVYNNTEYATTQSGTVWSKSFDIPTADVGNNSVYWNFTYGGEQIQSNTDYQDVGAINFSLAGASPQNNAYINFTFKDESTLANINASIASSTFIYYLGTGTVNKTLTFLNATENPSYAFAFNPPNRSLTVLPTIQYASTGYPQRIYNPSSLSLNNVTTNQTLYLLADADGLYVTYQVINTADQVISGVEVNSTRSISGSNVTVGTGTTDAAGSVTFWLNPNFEHYSCFYKSGFDLLCLTQFPTQSSYTITLGGGTSEQNNTYRGIDFSTLPNNSYLVNDTSYSFEFNVTSSFWDVSEFGFNLRLANGSIVGTDSSTTEGTPATFSYDVNNQSIIHMDYYWIISGNYTNGSRYWIVQNTDNTGWSIATFFTDFNTYLGTGLFGLDEFGRLLIIFVIIFMTSGVISYKYGLTSPIAISAIVFSTIFFFDIAVGIIPPIRGINYLLTYISALALVLVILSEVRR